MPRPTSETLDAIIQASVADVMRRVAPTIAAGIAQAAALRIEAELATATSRSGRRRQPRVELTRWVADRRARRVPNFVIQMTGGLDTKKKVVAKYGVNATFEKGKPPPATKDGKVSAKPARTKGRLKAGPSKTRDSADATEPSSGPGEKRAPSTEAARVVVARPPTVRKKAASAT